MTRSSSLPAHHPYHPGLRSITAKDDVYSRDETAEALFEQSGLTRKQISAL
jgi:hypothetical protein